MDIIDLDRGGNVYSIAKAEIIVVVRLDSEAAICIERDAKRFVLANV